MDLYKMMTSLHFLLVVGSCSFRSCHFRALAAAPPHWPPGQSDGSALSAGAEVTSPFVMDSQTEAEGRTRASETSR